MLEYEFSLTHVFPHWSLWIQSLSAKMSLREKCPYLEFSGHYFPTFGPEKLRMRTLFTQCMSQGKPVYLTQCTFCNSFMT